MSPFLFVYAISGNTTYVLSILAASLNIKHLAANAPWIAGTWLSEWFRNTTDQPLRLYGMDQGAR